MARTFLFIFILLVIIYTCRKKKVVNSFFNDKLYMSWFIMSFSLFDYNPTIIRYGIRIASIIFAGYHLIKYNKDTIFLPKKIVTFLIISYILLAYGSTLYSVDKIQTIVKSIEITIDVMLIWSIIKKYDKKLAFKNMIDIIMFTLVSIEIYVIIGSILMPSIFLVPSKGVLGYRLSGGIVSADSVGAICVLVVCYYLHIYRGQFKRCIIVLSIFEILLSQTRASIISLCIIVLIYFFKTKRKIFYLFALCIVFYLLLLNKEFVLEFFTRGASEGLMKNMSGRTTMWENAKVFISQRPLLGYGFGSGGEMVSVLNNGMTSLHSGIYECIMGVGYIGFSILLSIFLINIISLIICIINRGIKNCTFEIMILSDMTIRTYISTGIGGWHSHVLMIWFLLCYTLTYNIDICKLINENK